MARDGGPQEVFMDHKQAPVTTNTLPAVDTGVALQRAGTVCRRRSTW